MIARNDSTTINIPRPPTSIAGLWRFCADVAKALTALRDRRVIYNMPRTAAAVDCPLTAHVAGNLTDGYTVYVTTGISGDFVPTFDGNPVGDSNRVTLTGTDSLYLKITWTPGVEYDAGDAGYYITGGGTHVSSEFILADPRPTDTEAEVDFSTGATTDGVYHILWAFIDSTLPPPTITASRCGNHQITFCPGSLKLLFD